MPPPEPNTGVVLLAAGRGKRFGGDKLTVDFRGRPLWEWAAEAAENVGFTEHLLVVGRHSPSANRHGWRRIENPVAERGIGTSIAAGVRALTDCDRVLVMLADMPLVSPTHLDRLVASQNVAFTRYDDGKAGCPALFPRSVFPLLKSLVGDRGARSLDLRDFELIAPAYERELADVDVANDLERLNAANRGQMTQPDNQCQNARVLR